MTREDMLASIVRTVAERSTCQRKKVGSLIVLEGRILATGYAGSPRGMPHCIDVGCIIEPDGGCSRTIHAEVNALAFAARFGIPLDGADLWTTLSPCLPCAKLLINSGIKRCWVLEEYRDQRGIHLLGAAGISVLKYAAPSSR